MSKTLTPSSLQYGASPRFATRRNPHRKTRGAELAAIAGRLGTPLMAWQRQIADIGLELLDDNITPAYREIVITVPRQSGKTSLLLAWQVHRAIAWGSAQTIAYTAQTGFDARRKLMDDQVPALQNSTLAPAVRRIYTANGNESIIFKNGSRIQVLPSTPSAGHGKTISLAVLDEARFDYEGIREAALLPAMATKRDGQILIVSTAGTAESVYFRSKVNTGREAVKNNLVGGVAYFEYSADPDDDPYDPKVWERCMPALNLTIDKSAIDHALKTMSLTDFRLSYLNTWTTQDDRLIPDKVWLQCCSAKVAPMGRLSFGLDVALDRSSASIVVGDEQGRIEVIESRPGVAWVSQRCLEIARRWKAPIIVDGYSPAGALVEPLQNLGVNVVKYKTQEVIAACNLLYDAILDRNVKVKTSSLLNDAILNAKKRQVGQSWLWARQSLDADLTLLYAMTLAWHHSVHRKIETKPRSLIF